jgi:hypothetical protein
MSGWNRPLAEILVEKLGDGFGVDGIGHSPAQLRGLIRGYRFRQHADTYLVQQYLHGDGRLCF